MKNLTLIGVFLLAFGASALIVGGVMFTETRPVVLKAGPVEITAQEERHVSIPVVAGIIVMLVGAGLIIAGRRAT